MDKGEGELTAADLMPRPVPVGELVGDNFVSRSRALVETVLTTSGFTWLAPSRLICDAMDRDDAPSDRRRAGIPKIEIGHLYTHHTPIASSYTHMDIGVFGSSIFGLGVLGLGSLGLGVLVC